MTGKPRKYMDVREFEGGTVIEAAHYKEEVLKLKEDPIIIHMAMSIPPSYNCTIPDFTMAALTEYKKRCEEAGTPNLAHSIGGPKKAILAIRADLEEIYQRMKEV